MPLHLSYAGLTEAMSVLVYQKGSVTEASLPTTVSIDTVLLSCPPKQGGLM